MPAATGECHTISPATAATRSIDFTGAAGTAAAARRAARAFATTHSPADHRALVDAVELVVSELVTNAVRHAPGPCVLDLEHTGTEVRVAVHDTSRAHPTPRTRDPHRPAGHGLELVRSLSVRFTVTATHTGKTVTAHIRLPERPTHPTRE